MNPSTRRSGGPQTGPARELIDSGFALENADAPFLHDGLNLADIAHVLDLLRREIVPAPAARDDVPAVVGHLRRRARVERRCDGHAYSPKSWMSRHVSKRKVR